MSRNVVVVRRFLAVAVAAVLAAGLTACGGTNSPDPTPITTQLAPMPFSGIDVAEVAFTDVTVNGNGALTGSADWGSPANDIDIYVTNTACRATDVFELDGGCTVMGHTTSSTAKPELLTLAVTQGTYRVWIANFGPGAESGTLRLTATVNR
jgi:hypothetical protein